MPRAIIHIGSPKTGTSSFQNFIKAHAAWLLQRGVYVPQAGQLQNGGHHILARTLTGTFLPANWADARFDFDREIYDHPGKDILISAESLTEFLRAPHVRKRFFSAFRQLGFDIVVVLYIRAPYSFADSSYAQSTKSLVEAASFQDYITSEKLKSKYPHWRPLFSDPSITLRARPFNDEVKHGQIVSDLLQTIGITDAPPPFESRYNDSPGPVRVGLARWFYRRLCSERETISNKQRMQMVALIEEISTPLETSGQRYHGLTDRLAMIMRDDFHSELERMSQALWECDWDEAFPSLKTVGFETNDTEVTMTAMPPLAVWRDAQRRIWDGWRKLVSVRDRALEVPLVNAYQSLADIGVDIDGINRIYLDRFMPTAPHDAPKPT